MKIKGEVFGIRIDKIYPATFQLLIEDDGNWHEYGDCVSTHWMDELIEILQKAKKEVE